MDEGKRLRFDKTKRIVSQCPLASKKVYKTPGRIFFVERGGVVFYVTHGLANKF